MSLIGKYYNEETGEISERPAEDPPMEGSEQPEISIGEDILRLAARILRAVADQLD